MKGDLTLTSVIILFAMGTGGFFGIIMSGSQIKQDITYNTGDYNNIMETKMKAEQYDQRLPKEVNYTSNNLAITEITWRQEVPTEKEAVQELTEKLRKRLDEQMKLTSGCTANGITRLNMSEGSTTEYLVNTSETLVKCLSRSTDTYIPIEKDVYKVNNSKNQQIEAINYSANFTSNLKQEFDKKASDEENNFTANRSGSDECEDSSRSAADRKAKRNARNEIEREVRTIIENEKDDSDEVNIEWINKPFRRDVSAKGSCEFPNHLQKTETCEYSECTNCPTDEDEERETKQKTGTEYISRCLWDTHQVNSTLNITEDEKDITQKVWTKKGEIKPYYPWKYIYEP